MCKGAEVRVRVCMHAHPNCSRLISKLLCVQELRRLQLPWAWSSPASMYGVPDSMATASAAWEPIVDERAGPISYRAWRRPLRRGHYIYKSSTIVEGVSAEEFAHFNLHNHTRFLWDDSALLLEDLEPQGPPGCLSKFQQYRYAVCVSGRDAFMTQLLPAQLSCVLQRLLMSAGTCFRCRFPPPFSPREYVYARRVWQRQDGGCYIVSRNCNLPPGSRLAEEGGRTSRVADYASCMMVQQLSTPEASEPGLLCLPAAQLWNLDAVWPYLSLTDARHAVQCPSAWQSTLKTPTCPGRCPRWPSARACGPSCKSMGMHCSATPLRGVQLRPAAPTARVLMAAAARSSWRPTCLRWRQRAGAGPEGCNAWGAVLCHGCAPWRCCLPMCAPTV